MPASTKMTVRRRNYLKKRLARLTRDDREHEIIGGIGRGLADVKAGRVVSHADAKAEIHAVIKLARAKNY